MNWQALRDSTKSPGALITAIRQAIPVLYAEYIRPLLPKTGEYIRYNGVAVAEECTLDRILPTYFTEFVQTESQPNYEEPLIGELRKFVSLGDTVVVVGGGLGVSATIAAAQVGPEGQVHVYEGSEKHVRLITKTLLLNEVSSGCTVHHAIVGQANELRAHPGDADFVAPDALPQCDVLELDCEGSELEILREMTIEPPTIVVETHSNLGSPTSSILNVLDSRGYEIVGQVSVNSRRGIDIVTAVRR